MRALNLMESRSDSMCSFLILFVLFVIALELSEFDRLTVAEGIFMLYALGTFNREGPDCLRPLNLPYQAFPWRSWPLCKNMG